MFRLFRPLSLRTSRQTYRLVNPVNSLAIRPTLPVLKKKPTPPPSHQWGQSLVKTINEKKVLTGKEYSTTFNVQGKDGTLQIREFVDFSGNRKFIVLVKHPGVCKPANIEFQVESKHRTENGDLINSVSHLGAYKKYALIALFLANN